MYILLVLTIAVLAGSDITGLDLSLAPGLSAKNALLNVIAASLLTRLVIQGKLRLMLPTIQTCFLLTFLYGALSVLAIVLIIQYPHYRLFDSIVALKFSLFDPMLFFFTFLYAVKSQEECISMTKVLLIAVTVANAVTITNVVGITNIGQTVWGNNDMYEGGRVFGVFGHANETGAVIACLLPAYVATAEASKGFWKLVWGGMMAVSLIMLVMTGSRGAIAAIAIGGAAAGYLCRRYISFAKGIRWAIIVALIGIPLLTIVGAQFGSQFLDRIIGQALSGSVGEMSSGRNEIWANAIEKMMESPLSLITGFGWGAYASMGFKLIPHNHYIAMWFELGLVGVLCFVIIIQQCVSKLMAVLPAATPEMRRYFVAGVFGVLTLAVAVFFEQMFKPWFYLWPYIAVTMRGALLVRKAESPSAQPVDLAPRRLREQPSAASSAGRPALRRETSR